MTKITIFQPNGEVIQREMTPDELAQWEADKAQAEAELEAKNQAALAKAAAEAKLIALGISLDDLKALGLA
jgi:hypothetical protein